MELDVLLRGQSNAQLLASDTNQAIAQEVQQLLGFDGSNNKVVLLAAWDTPGAQSIVGSSAFIGDWMRQDTNGQWQPQADEQDLLNFAAQHQGATETAVLWVHNEYDSTNPAMNTADWTAAVRADAALLRLALGQDAAHSPYMFVSAIPFEFASDASTRAIRAGMEQLAADPGFHAGIAARALDLDMDYRYPSEGPNYHTYGGDHISAGDASLIADRALAQEWADYAQPGSPVALAGGDIADLGPQVAAATLTASDTLTLTLALDAAGGLQPLDAAAASGIGWSVRSGGTEVDANQASITGDETLQLHFPSALPTDGRLVYGYGYGRLAGWDQPGHGNAVYDSAGLPAWTPAAGVALGTAPPTPPPAAASLDRNAIGAAANDYPAATGGWWSGSYPDLLAWDSTYHGASPPTPATAAEPSGTVDWNALAAQVMANRATTGGWHL